METRTIQLEREGHELLLPARDLRINGRSGKDAIIDTGTGTGFVIGRRAADFFRVDADAGEERVFQTVGGPTAMRMATVDLEIAGLAAEGIEVGVGGDSDSMVLLGLKVLDAFVWMLDGNLLTLSLNPAAPAAQGERARFEAELATVDAARAAGLSPEIAAEAARMGADSAEIARLVAYHAAPQALDRLAARFYGRA